MPKAGFYAVAKGRVPGIYPSWEECQAQITGFLGASHQKFKTLREAEEFAGVSSISSPYSIASRSRSVLPVSKAMSQTTTLPDTSNVKSVVLGTEEEMNERGYDVVFCDGACKGNGKEVGSVAGIGVWWGYSDKRNIAERCPGVQTNNRAELISIVRALEETPAFGRPLIIKTDSTYSIKCLELWHQTWVNNGWKTSSGKTVLNSEIILYLLALLQLRGLQGSPVKFVHVKGHAGIIGNEGADAQANLGTLLPETPDRTWKAERERVETLISELQGCPEVIDKAVQAESEDDENDLLKQAGNLNVEALGPVQSPAKDASSGSAPSPSTQDSKPPPQVSEPGEDEYSVEDLLDDDELAAELAE